MSTFVLVHGAYTGAHGWHLVRPLLRQAGHEVYSVCLTGLGERSHLARPDVNLTTHITDVVNTLEFEDLRGVVLVGHSYGGMSITGAADRVPERIAHLVYLDAFLPNDGQSMQDLTGGRDVAPDGVWLVPPVDRDMANKEDKAWLTPRRRGQPRETFTEKLKLSKPLEQQPFSRTYIKATAEPGEAERERPSHFMQAGARAKADPAWQYIEINTGHMAMNDDPEGLASLLLTALPLTAVAAR